uniref:Uncharacterized protein n=1 Tax=Rhizophora mucronata TaxID=61149 RepID=A0A2P2PG83_RHIMU
MQEYLLNTHISNANTVLWFIASCTIATQCLMHLNILRHRHVCAHTHTHTHRKHDIQQGRTATKSMLL